MSVYLSRQVAGLDRYRLRGHRVGSGMPGRTRYARMRDGRLERFCSTLCPAALRMPGPFCVVRHASPFGTGPKGAKARPGLSLPTGAKESGAKKSPVALGRSTGHNAAVLRRDVPLPAPIGAESGSLRAAGTNPMTSCPSKRDPGSSRLSFRAPWKGSKGSVHSSLPLPSPAGETSFYPASAIKGAKPRPLSLS